jgi:hypothetical protein
MAFTRRRHAQFAGVRFVIGSGFSPAGPEEDGGASPTDRKIPEPARLADQGPFGGATPNWPRTAGQAMPSYGEVQNWFDTLDLFASPGGFGPV